MLSVNEENSRANTRCVLVEQKHVNLIPQRLLSRGLSVEKDNKRQL